MKTSQLRDILKLTAGICRDAGGAEVAKSFDNLALLCDGRESTTVTAFTALLDKAATGTGERAS